MVFPPPLELELLELELLEPPLLELELLEPPLLELLLLAPPLDEEALLSGASELQPTRPANDAKNAQKTMAVKRMLMLREMVGPTALYDEIDHGWRLRSRG